MNIFKTISFAMSLGKVVDEVKKTIETNSAIGEKIAEIIGDVIEILNKVKALVPQIDDAISTIIEIIKRWFKK